MDGIKSLAVSLIWTLMSTLTGEVDSIWGNAYNSDRLTFDYQKRFRLYSQESDTIVLTAAQLDSTEVIAAPVHSSEEQARRFRKAWKKLLDDPKHQI